MSLQQELAKKKSPAEIVSIKTTIFIPPRDSVSGRGERFSVLPRVQDQLWILLSLLFNGYRSLFPALKATEK